MSLSVMEQKSKIMLSYLYKVISSQNTSGKLFFAVEKEKRSTKRSIVNI